jgi:hypothetical protein
MDTNRIAKLHSFASNPKIAIFETLDEINNKLDNVMDMFKDLDLSAVETIKGDKGDGLTDEEKQAMKDEVTPIKGLHYFDGEECTKCDDLEPRLTALEDKAKQWTK